MLNFNCCCCCVCLWMNVCCCYWIWDLCWLLFFWCCWNVWAYWRYSFVRRRVMIFEMVFFGGFVEYLDFLCWWWSFWFLILMFVVFNIYVVVFLCLINLEVVLFLRNRRGFRFVGWRFSDVCCVIVFVLVCICFCWSWEW